MGAAAPTMIHLPRVAYVPYPVDWILHPCMLLVVNESSKSVCEAGVNLEQKQKDYLNGAAADRLQPL
jgi:hypothetical protein